jgi:hypothetical protein
MRSLLSILSIIQEGYFLSKAAENKLAKIIVTATSSSGKKGMASGRTQYSNTGTRNNSFHPIGT